MDRKIRRGEIYIADLDPVIGSEQGGERPVLVIQNNVGNTHSPIKKQIEDLRVIRNKLLSEDEDERCIEELRHLKRILNDSPKTLSEIDKELFTSIVTKIYAEQNGDITFCLLGELQLRMEVK